MPYEQLARYVGTRAAAAVQDAEGEYRDVLQRVADAASRWALRDGTFTQCWIEITARWPGGAPPSPPPAPDARARGGPGGPTKTRGAEAFGTKSGARAYFCWSKGLLPDVQYDGRFGQPGNPKGRELHKQTLPPDTGPKPTTPLLRFRVTSP
jgi:hypothetical protein